jgi:hypothetical protein
VGAATPPASGPFVEPCVPHPPTANANAKSDAEHVVPIEVLVMIMILDTSWSKRPETR